MRYLSIKNLKKHQHYKDRRPPWIKLHAEVLDDYAFSCLQDASKAHLMLLWVLASRMDNRIPYDLAFLARKLGATDPVDVEALVEHGFIEVSDDDSATLAPRKQSALPETERETEAEGERETETTPAPSASRGKRARAGKSKQADENNCETVNLTAFAEAYLQRFPGAEYPGARFGKTLKGLVRKHGHDETLRRWGIFLDAKGELGAEYFARTWSEWNTKPVEVRRGPFVSVTEEAARQQKLTEALEERYAADRKRAGVRWAHEHPDEFAPIRATVEDTYRGQSGEFIAKTKEIELALRCAAAAGFPSFDEWRSNNNPPQAGAA